MKEESRDAAVVLDIIRGEARQVPEDSCLPLWPPLQWAAWCGQARIVEELLKRTPHPLHAWNMHPISPMIFATQGGHVAVMRLLLHAGFKAEESSGEPRPAWIAHEFNPKPHRSLVHMAAASGHPEAMKLLLDHGAAIDAEDEYEYTALNWAASRGCTPMLRVLLRYGADINHMPRDNFTPLRDACTEGCADTVRLLLKKGARVSEGGSNPLNLATLKGFATTTKVLLEHGVKCNEFGYVYGPPLLMATLAGHAGIVRHLLQRGARANLGNGDQHYALTAAASRGEPRIVRELLKHGADPTLPDKEGKTALDLTPAHARGIRRMLQEAMARAPQKEEKAASHGDETQVKKLQ